MGQVVSHTIGDTPFLFQNEKEKMQRELTEKPPTQGWGWGNGGGGGVVWGGGKAVG